MFVSVAVGFASHVGPPSCGSSLWESESRLRPCRPDRRHDLRGVAGEPRRRGLIGVEQHGAADSRRVLRRTSISRSPLLLRRRSTTSSETTLIRSSALTKASRRARSVATTCSPPRRAGIRPSSRSSASRFPSSWSRSSARVSRARDLSGVARVHDERRGAQGDGSASTSTRLLDRDREVRASDRAVRARRGSCGAARPCSPWPCPSRPSAMPGPSSRCRCR